MTDKSSLRARMRRVRAEIYQTGGREINRQITAQFLAHPAYRRAENLFIYLSVQDEADTRPIIADALHQGKAVYVPVCRDDHTMDCVRLHALQDLIPGRYQIPIPKPPRQIISKETVYLAVVPGLAFDRTGNRLGYGGGYYDRFLADYPGTALGLCYAGCLLDSLPCEGTDQPVDGIMTERGFFHPGQL